MLVQVHRVREVDDVLQGQHVPERLEGWHAMFDNNLHPVFYLSREVAPAMMERKWGRIVNFSVANAEQQVGQPGITAYYIAIIIFFLLPSMGPSTHVGPILPSFRKLLRRTPFTKMPS